tara:strand:- start:1723 stop:2304 length:582 start_codon:yes stop_codon:yes gene_type:complete
MIKPKKNSFGEYSFSDYPEFIPNLSPKEIFQSGSFGGTYWRPIKSGVTEQNYKNIHKQYPKEWWKGLSDNKLTSPWKDYDKNLNKYGVKVGTTLEEWEDKSWIMKYHPYGWVHWYCDFFIGKRCNDDERQIGRWLGLASKKGRFRKWLVTLILKKNSEWDDYSISPKIRQTLQHWAYTLTETDFNTEVNNRKL